MAMAMMLVAPSALQAKVQHLLPKPQQITATETAVDSIPADKDSVKTEIYDLSGRRINNPAKGVYIMNGKAVLVK